MAGFTKLFSSIVTSSIWSEDDKTRIMWITMLALAGEDGVVEASLPGLAKVAGMPIADAERSLQRLMEPDPYSRTPDHDGRRVAPCESGWVLLNHGKYRGRRGRQLSEDPRAVYSREWMRERRNAVNNQSTSSQQSQHLVNIESTVDQQSQPSVSVSESSSSDRESPERESIKSTPETAIPSKLDTSDFRQAWKEWCCYMADAHRPLVQMQADQTLRELMTHGPDKAASMIRASIARGWKYIHEPLAAPGQAQQQAKQAAPKLGKDSDPALHDYARQLWIAKRDRADRDTFGMIYRKVRDAFGEQWVAAVKAAALDLERAERGFVLT